jgi:arylsulfatase A
MEKMKKIGLFGSMMAAAACTPEAEQKPNIVFFFADDIGVECFGCYG